MKSRSAVAASHKAHFSRFLDAETGRLHFAAHSHHLWPDVSFEAHQRAWLDAAELADEKWDRIFGEVVPRSKGHIARILNLSDPESLVFAPNTHEFLVRLLSCFEERRTVRILATDGEFHSFERQCRRWEEAGHVQCERVEVEPFETFEERFRERVATGEHDLVFFSHVFFNSGFAVRNLRAVVEAAPDPGPMIVVDGYHGFMALPTDLAPIEKRAFYLAGGYKYAMSGEGVCFLHCPPGHAMRPVDTGWYAGFADLEEGEGGRIAYSDGGARLFGATFDASGLYRFNANMDLWRSLDLAVADIHAHVRGLQLHFLDGLEGLALESVKPEQLIPPSAFAERGHFLTFRTPRAGEIRALLREHRIITDHRDDRLRFGFGIYHDRADVDLLLQRLGELLS